MSKPIVVLAPTEIEIALFRECCKEQVVIEICGIGAAETAANTALAIAKHDPQIIVLAGIAGAYPESGLSIGTSVIVEHEHIADMGAFHEDGFKHKFAKTYVCEIAAKIRSFAKVDSNSVSACAAPYVDGTKRSKIENMEGAAFFAVCTAFDTPFLELRTISNEVSTQRIGWDIPLATSELSKSLTTLINEIKS